MSTLPQLGNVVQLFGVGCEGCGYFRGQFEVESVYDDGITKLVLEPQSIHCEGSVEEESFSPMTLLWNREFEYWQGDCNGQGVVVNISGHFRGPSRATA